MRSYCEQKGPLDVSVASSAYNRIADRYRLMMSAPYANDTLLTLLLWVYGRWNNGSRPCEIAVTAKTDARIERPPTQTGFLRNIRINPEAHSETGVNNPGNRYHAMLVDSFLTSNDILKQKWLHPSLLNERNPDGSSRMVQVISGEDNMQLIDRQLSLMYLVATLTKERPDKPVTALKFVAMDSTIKQMAAKFGFEPTEDPRIALMNSFLGGNRRGVTAFDLVEKIHNLLSDDAVKFHITEPTSEKTIKVGDAPGSNIDLELSQLAERLPPIGHEIKNEIAVVSRNVENMRGKLPTDPRFKREESEVVDIIDNFFSFTDHKLAEKITEGLVDKDIPVNEIYEIFNRQIQEQIMDLSVSHETSPAGAAMPAVEFIPEELPIEQSLLLRKLNIKWSPFWIKELASDIFQNTQRQYADRDNIDPSKAKEARPLTSRLVLYPPNNPAFMDLVVEDRATGFDKSLLSTGYLEGATVRTEGNEGQGLGMANHRKAIEGRHGIIHLENIMENGKVVGARQIFRMPLSQAS